MASKYSSIDNSPTKQKYSFPKAERFPKISIYGAMSFYNLPSVKNERATSFGYGSRYNFCKKNAETTPSCYNYCYGVESKQPYAPKYSFGLGRENMKNNYTDKYIPGPGKYYSLIKSIGNGSPKYSIKGKYKSSLSPRSESPGPAAYDPHTKMNPLGVFGIAGYKNVKSYDFSKGVLDRFNYKQDKTPGPAEYNNKTLMGNIYDSRFRSTHGIHMTFRHEQKEKDNYPGPGAYERYGDFYKYNDRSFNESIYSIKKSRKNSFKTPQKERKIEEINKSKNEEINKSKNEEVKNGKEIVNETPKENNSKSGDKQEEED